MLSGSCPLERLCPPQGTAKEVCPWPQRKPCLTWPTEDLTNSWLPLPPSKLLRSPHGPSRPADLGQPHQLAALHPCGLEIPGFPAQLESVAHFSLRLFQMPSAVFKLQFSHVALLPTCNTSLSSSQPPRHSTLRFPPTCLHPLFSALL